MTAGDVELVWEFEDAEAVTGRPFGDRLPGLPFAVASGQAATADPPSGVVAVHRVSRDDLDLAVMVSVFRMECGELSRTVRTNGRRGGFDQAPFLGWDAQSREMLPVYGVQVPVPVGVPGVLNLSLQKRPSGVAEPNSPVGHAIRLAGDRMPVVVAAGNWRTLGRDRDTLNPLAKLPGVVSVGATVDEAGTVLTTNSSAGAAGRSGPTVCAYGADPYVDGVIETSFAAPRVAGLTLFLRAFLLQLHSVMTTWRTGVFCAVPVMVQGVVDIGFDGYDPAPDLALPMQPYGLGIDTDHCREVLRHLPPDVELPQSAALVVALLLRSATSMTGAPHEVGHGFVDVDRVVAMLAGLTWADLLGVAGVPLPADAAAGWGHLPVARSADLPTLHDVAVRSTLRYGLDVSSGTILASVRPPL